MLDKRQSIYTKEVDFTSQTLAEAILTDRLLIFTRLTSNLSVLLSPKYTEYAGLEIRVDLGVALRPRKTAMLVLNCTGAYGRNAVFRPSCLVEAMQ